MWLIVKTAVGWESAYGGRHKKITAELHSQAIISFLNYYYLCYDLNCHFNFHTAKLRQKSYTEKLIIIIFSKTGHLFSKFN